MERRVSTVCESLGHYALLYLLLLIPGSCVISKYLNNTAPFYLVIALHILLLIFSPRFRNTYVLWIEALLLITFMFVRSHSGGAGSMTLLRLIAVLSITYLAIAMNKQMFMIRFVRIVVVFAVISVIFWAVFCIAPGLVNVWPATTFWTQDMGTGQWAVSLHGKGLWLYSYLEVHPTRNCGLYTEPGVYQVVLNAALIVLLFFRDQLEGITSRQYAIYLSVIILTLLTCQSTTGYIAMLTIILFYLIASNSERKASSTRMAIIIGMILVLIVTFLDYAWRGVDSVLYQQVIYKFFGSSTGDQLDLSQGTGRARTGTIAVSIQSILNDPWGIGADKFDVLKNEYGRALVAGSFFAFPAQYGVLPWIIMLCMLAVPLFKRYKVLVSLLICIIFINTTLAQTFILYTGLIIFSVYAAINPVKNTKVSK